MPKKSPSKSGKYLFLNRKFNSKMNILYLIDHMGFGGAQTVVKGIIEDKSNLEAKYLYILHKKKPQMHFKNNRNFIFGNEKVFPLSISNFRNIKKIIEEKKINILHCHLFASEIVGLVMKTMFFPNLTVIFHEHGKIVGSDNKSCLNSKIYVNFLKIAKNKVYFIAVSKFTTKFLIKKANIPANKIYLMYNFVDLNRLTAEKGKRSSLIEHNDIQNKIVVGFIGRLIERKGWRDFLEAAKILKKHNKILFLIAGDGKDRNNLLEEISKYKLHNTEYLGYIDDIRLFYSAIDILVVPSHWEPLGLTPLEGQSMGVSVIATNVPGMSELLEHKVNAILVKKHNPKEISESIELLIKDQRLKEKLKNNGIKNAMRYNIDQYMTKLDNLYTSLVSGEHK